MADREAFIAKAMELADDYARLQAVSEGEGFSSGDVTKAERDAEDARGLLEEHLRSAAGVDAVRQAEADLQEMRQHGNVDDTTEAAAHLERAKHAAEVGGSAPLRIAGADGMRDTDGAEGNAK